MNYAPARADMLRLTDWKLESQMPAKILAVLVTAAIVSTRVHAA